MRLGTAEEVHGSEGTGDLGADLMLHALAIEGEQDVLGFSSSISKM